MRINAQIHLAGLLRLFFAGLVVTLGTWLLIYAAIYAYLASPLIPQDAGLEYLRTAGARISVWGGPLVFLGLTGCAASIIARGSPGSPRVYGVLTGLTAALGYQAFIYVFYPPLLLRELSLYVLLGLAGGIAGAHVAHNALSTQAALHRTTRRISAVRDPAELAAAIGENLGHPGLAAVSVWLPPDDEEAGTARGEGGDALRVFENRASWSPGRAVAWPRLLHLSSADADVPLARLQKGGLVELRPADLDGAHREAWSRNRFAAGLLAPMLDPTGDLVGLLLVASSIKGRPTRAASRDYLTAARQAGLALAYLRRGVRLERARLSREIHDTLTQGYVGILNHIGAALGEGGTGGHTQDRSIRRYLELAEGIARENLEEARRLVAGLKPGPLEEGDLPQALDLLARRWSDGSHARARVVLLGRPVPLRPQAQLELYRAVQEALTNARKHSGAFLVTITLSYMEDLLVVDVLDDGCGFAAGALPSSHPAPGGGIGLRYMRERIERVGGTLQVESAPGQGTGLAINLPLGNATGLPTDRYQARADGVR